MKSFLILSIIISFLLTSIKAQTSEEIAAQNYTQHTTVSNENISNGSDYYLFNGTRYTELEGQKIWVGETSVMNSTDGSFQVCFKKIPTTSRKYPVKPYGTYSEKGTEDDASVVLLTDNYSTQYWSIVPNKGSIKVTVNRNSISIVVKNVKLCIDNTDDCKNITGKVTLNKE